MRESARTTSAALGEQFTDLHGVGSEGGRALATQLVTSPRHLHATDEWGFVPLMIATRDGYEHGADIGQANGHHETAVMLAIDGTRESNAVLEILLKRRSDMKALLANYHPEVR